MVDVFHTLFEEDTIPQYENQMEAKSALRTIIYRDLYKREYEYKVRSKEERRFVPDDADPMDVDLPPEKQPTKPFIPATNPEDLPGILDRPFGS